jgi:phosphoribosylamine--glycine ligase
LRVFLVTISARGHAIAEALVRSSLQPEIIHVCTARNPGIRKLAKEQVIVDSLMNFPAILEVAKRAKPDFAFIAPDDPIGGGLADELCAIGIPSVAPKKALARIESSKSFARELMKKYEIDANPKLQIFQSSDSVPMYRYMDTELRGEYVVKYDGLLGGKGVKVSGEHLKTVEEGVAYAKECIEKGGQVVIEEKLQGVEFSLMSFVSEDQVVSMPAVQDHKRAYEGDTGPNTGGMGSYSDADHKLPFLETFHVEEAHRINCAVAKALIEECGEPYKGILYGGFMAIPGMKGMGSSKVIEYNARFGDPEALNVLPILKTDFVEICQAILSGGLNKISIQFEPLATVCKYIVPKSYPVSKGEKGQEVKFPSVIPSSSASPASIQRSHSLASLGMTQEAERIEGRIYFGDISEDPDGTLHLGGSRTAGIVGIGRNLEEAEKIAQELCEKVQGPVRFRRDIGTNELIQERNRIMNKL